jgi:hypothetical protein
MASVQDMAQAHLQNVQQQIGELENKKVQIDADIATLKSYLEQGVAELRTVSNVSVDQSTSTIDMSNPTSSMFK